MVTYQVNDSYPPFEYGSAVRWRRPDGQPVVGSICGFDVVASAGRASVVGYPLGTVLALVEENSGGTVEVSIEELELI